MKMPSSQWRRLKWHLLAFLAMAAAGSSTALWAHREASLAEREERQLAADEAAQKQRALRAPEEARTSLARIERYRQLTAEGIIGPEERTAWMGQTERAGKFHHLISLQYQLAPRRPTDSTLLPEGAAGGGFEFMSTSMHLQTHLLHEGDLLDFLADLRDSAHALLVVRRCNIERLVPAANKTAGPAARLQADCDIDWITVRENP